ncbi:Uncharacterized protein FKW44_003651, partial [Caligus rogercresseyi]
FIINDMFGFAFSFVGINPNVARVMMVAIIQFIGWTTVAMEKKAKPPRTRIHILYKPILHTRQPIKI